MIKDYNKKLLEALHSVFWYNGLLERYRDEWVTFKDTNGFDFKRPKYEDDSVIIRMIDELRKKKITYDFYDLDDVSKLNGEFGPNGDFNIIWMMLVEMFGKYAMTSRTGWIEEVEECADFLEQVMWNCPKDWWGGSIK